MFSTSTLQDKRGEDLIRGWMGPQHPAQPVVRQNLISTFTFFPLPFPCFFSNLLQYHTMSHPVPLRSVPLCAGTHKKNCAERHDPETDLRGARGAARHRKDAQREMLRTATTSLVLQVCVSLSTTKNLQFLEAEIRMKLSQEPWLGVHHQLKRIRPLGLTFLSFSQAVSPG